MQIQQAPNSPKAVAPPKPARRRTLIELAIGYILMATIVGLGIVCRNLNLFGTTEIIGGVFIGLILDYFLLIYSAANPATPTTDSTYAPHADAFREVVETVVFVVVLVLLLKSFAAEAFVIPTGSMAETLWGYQKVVTCPSCEHQFPVNCTAQVDPQDGRRPEFILVATCPNCRQHITFKPAHDRFADAIVPAGAVEVPDPTWGSGDRVLVAKFLYDLLNQVPNRHDVVVFKYPGDKDFPSTGPHKNHTPMNYIKRLIGLPGETIAICGGKVYALSPDRGLSYPEDLRAGGQELTGEALHDRLAELWQKNFMHVDNGIGRFKDGQFTIIRKSPEVMMAVRRIVFDNDHQPKDEEAKRLPPRWKGDSWTAEGTNFKGQATTGEAPAWLVYRNMLRGNNDKPSLITDFLGYNTYETYDPETRNSSHKGNFGENWVGDLMIDCQVTVDSNADKGGKPALILELGKGVDRFQARFDLDTGMCVLSRITAGKEETLAEGRPTGVRAGGTYNLCFANVDEKLTLWVNGSLPFGRDGVIYNAPKDADRGPRKDDFEPARIGITKGGVTVRKLKLFRDLYYTTGGAGQADVSGVTLTDPSTWDVLKDMPINTYYVQPHHFLCLGDNSPESSDGRTWGLVPERLMLGRALVVYYPFYSPFFPFYSQVNRQGLIK